MEKIFANIVQLLEAQQECVLATAIRTRGSTPQKAGARLLVRPDGSSEGTLGGGCMEGDIYYAATEMLRRQQAPQLLSYQLNEEMAARDGLVCGGTMYFWLKRLGGPKGDLALAQSIHQACRGSAPLALATVIKAGRNSPQTGSQLLFDATTIPPKDWPPEIAAMAREVAKLGQTRYLNLADGLEIFLEGFTTAPTLVILGGGHVGKALAGLAKPLGFEILVVDDRENFANPQRFPEARQTIALDFEGLAAALQQLRLSENSYIVIATRGHRYDDLALEAALQTPANYIGLLGSKRKTLMIYKNLLDKGYDLKRLAAIRAPLGLDIGALSPEELAVSILAEIIALRRAAAGGLMTMSEAEIRTALKIETRPSPAKTGSRRESG